MTLETTTPVLLLGGKENALSIVRHLGRLGIPVRVSGPANCWALHSRWCAQALPVPKRSTQAAYWSKLLLGNDGSLNGHIVWPMSDEAIAFVQSNRGELALRYRLGEGDAQLQADFLDKMKTLELARLAGVAAPQFWNVKTEEDLAALRGAVRFPVMVKPIQSHLFTKEFGRKLFIIDNSLEELGARVRDAWSRGLDVFVVEMVPGPDSLLSSYYTYRTANGRRLFDFTKSIIRRWPVNRGNACFHKSGWDAETADAGQRFFEGVGLKGLGNIEFKRDPRDGQLKIIEVNARFTAAQELVRRAGFPIDLMIYCHLTGQPVPVAHPAEKPLYFWYPLRDFFGFVELWRRGELSFGGWLKSIAKSPVVFPLASFSDPRPVFGAAMALATRLFG